MSKINVWVAGNEVTADLELRVAQTFYQTFSCPPNWSQNPMPLGEDTEEPGTVRNMLRGFLNSGLEIVLATVEEKGKDREESLILGFALGGLIDERLHETFGLAEYGAEIGDGVLPFAGMLPVAQGYRLVDGSVVRNECGVPVCGKGKEGESLYRILFKTRMEQTVVSKSPTTWLRTRQCLAPVICTARKFGFEYRDTFYINFRGEVQDRMVYKRG